MKSATKAWFTMAIVVTLSPVLANLLHACSAYGGYGLGVPF